MIMINMGTISEYFFVTDLKTAYWISKIRDMS